MASSVDVTLLNPHADDFVKTPVSFRFAGRRGLMKYAYLIDGPVKLGRRVDILIDGTLSSLIRQDVFGLFPAWARRLFLRAELAVWLRINNLKEKVVIHWSPESVPDRSVLYLFSYKNCIGAFDARRKIVDAFKYKLINMSHYFILTEQKARNIRALSGVVYVSEADLRAVPYFQKYFSTDSEMIALPFAVPFRFHTDRSVESRAPLCAATGSFHNLYEERPRQYYKDFFDFFASSTYHPVRKAIYERQSELREWIRCCVYPYRERRAKGQFLGKLFAGIGLDVTQRAYFSFNIVDFYNEHIFALVGEELPGLPAIGFFEAMACGCVVLGADSKFYGALGLHPGTHYLHYDGTIDDALRVLETARHAPESLERMSKAAQAYVEDFCRPPAVHARFMARVREVMSVAVKSENKREPRLPVEVLEGPITT